MRPLRVYALDAAGSRLAGNLDVVAVPWEPLRCGPLGRMFEIDTHDPTTGETYPTVDLDEPSVLLGQGLTPTPSDPRFHSQMVYAVASLTYAAFRSALGRDLSWGFEDGAGRQALRLRPFVGGMRNAYYDHTRGEVAFGYFNADESVHGRNFPGSQVFTALSHDIVVHEITHALLDGLRAHFLVPTNPDVLAFHEGFADLVAIFQKFSYRDLVAHSLRKTRGSLRIQSMLNEVAAQFGHTTGTGGPLRSPLDLDQSGQPTVYNPDLPPHCLGTVLTSAVFEAFTAVYERKVATILRLATGRSTPDPEVELSSELTDLLAKEVARLAKQFRNMVIRAIDYCPPVDLSLGEFLRAAVTADWELVPDDPWGYREAWIDAFAKRRLIPDNVPNLSERSLLWRAPAKLRRPVPGLSFADLRFQGDPARSASEAELIKQAEALGDYVSLPEHRQTFRIEPPGPEVDVARVESIRSARRGGPNGRVLFDLVAEVTQRFWRETSNGQRVPAWRGSTVVIDPEGEVRYVIWSSGELDDGEEYPPATVKSYWQQGAEWSPRPNILGTLHDESMSG